MPHLRYLHIGVLVSLCLEAASPWQAWPVPPRDIMADITNDLGICLLQVMGRESRENVAFSPYGVMSIVFLLYEGSHGNTAIEIYNSLRLPWDRHMSRIGFRDLHRHIKSYFSNDRFLRGLVLSKPSVPLKHEYVRLLNFYGFYPNNEESSGPAPVPPAESEGKGRPEPELPAQLTTALPPTYQPAQLTTWAPYVTTVIVDEPVRTTDYDTESPVYDPTPKPTKPPVTKDPDIITRPYKPSKTTYPSSGRFETDPTPPPFEPTRHKTTQTYSPTKVTKKKPPARPGGNRVTTVKPGYNSHGMTQFFTDHPPTTSDDHFTHGDRTPPVDDNIIFTDGNTNYERPVTKPTTDSTLFSPSTRPNDSENEVHTSDKTSPKWTTDTQAPTESTPDTDKIVFPTESTSSDDSTPGFDIRFANVQDPESVLEDNTEKVDLQMVSEQAQGRSKENIEAISDDNLELEKMTTKEEESAKTTTLNLKESTTAKEEETIKTTTLNHKEGTTTREEETTKTTTLNVEERATTDAKIMTQKEVENANRMVETLSAPVTGDRSEDAPSTLATILMSMGYTKSNLSSVSNQGTPITSETSDLTGTTVMMTDTTERMQVNDTATTDVDSTNSTDQQENQSRKKRSLIGPPHPYDHREQGINNWIPSNEGPHWEYSVPRDQWFFSYSASEPVPVLTYMDYLPFAFIQSINTLALQLPLDDPRYSMLILLPMERFGLDQLLASIHQCSIREIIQDLRVIPVYAVLPAFTLVKHVDLVPTLSQLGITEVFDPSRSDLSGMADEPHLYVRSIEQLVTVSLRKYHYSTRRFDGRPEEIRHHFIANHPFLYFVLDTETGAALMTGTIINPTAYKQQRH